MKVSQFRLAIIVVVGVVVLGACNSFKSHTDDKTITTEIQAKLFSDPVLKTRDIRVDSHDGSVTLSGTVGTDLEKSAVERIARQEGGVKNVVNTLTVETPSTTAPPETAQNAAAAPPAEAQASPAPPAEQPAPAKPHRKHHAPAAEAEAASSSNPPDNTPPAEQPPQDKAAADLQAYTAQTASGAAAAPVAPAQPAQPAAPASPPPAAAAPPPPAPPAPQPHVTIPAGAVVTVRMVDSIDSSKNTAGQDFAATLDSPILAGDRSIGTRGADARVRLVQASSAGRISGQSQLQLELISVTLNGVPYTTQSNTCQKHGASRGTRSAETIGGGAVVGALLGGLLGRGRGAAIGSIAGAGAGTAVQVSTQGQQVKVPSETKLDFTLKDPVDVAVGPGQ